MLNLTKKILAINQKHNLIKKNERVIVATSGGPDSIALLHILNSIKKDYRLRLHVLHINHLMRGKESIKDAEFVRKISTRLGLPFHCYEVNVPKYRKKHRLSLEEAGRICRGKIYARLSKKIKAGKIALAHTLDDHAETILMKLLRGCGTEGLEGINMKKVPFIRPLIETKKEEIIRFLKNNKIKYRTDKSNFKKNFTRNKIRLDLIPKLEKEYNPNLKKLLWQTSQITAEDNHCLNQKAAQEFERISKTNKNQVFLEIKKAVKLHPAILMRIFKISIKTLQKNQTNINFTHYKALSNLLGAKTGKKITLPGNLTAYKEYNKIILSKKNNENKKISKTILKLNGITRLETINRSFLSKILKKMPETLKCSSNKIYVDFNKCGREIIVRSRNKGDRFYPLGMRGSKKVKNFLIDNKIPQDQRVLIPVLEARGKILWLTGLRMDERFKVDKKTRKILMIEYLGIAKCTKTSKK